MTLIQHGNGGVISPESMVNPKVGELIAYIVNDINSRGKLATKEKVLMLLYLFDIEYYRTHRETFTGFTWVWDDEKLLANMTEEAWHI